MHEKKICGLSSFIISFLLLILSILMLVPFIWMISTSFKYDMDAFSIPVQWIPENPTLNNYIRVWTEEPFLLFYRNTVIVVFFATVLKMLVSCMASYAFAKLKFIGRNVMFALITATMMVPWQVMMIPQYRIISAMYLTDTLAALVITQVASAFAIFMMRQFMMSIPDELRESGLIDGAGEGRIFASIMLPQVKAAIATLTILSFIQVWNDYQAPLIYINSQSKFTIQLGLQFFNSAHTMQYGVIMAGTVCSLIPIFLVFFIFQKQVTSGMISSGIKG